MAALSAKSLFTAWQEARHTPRCRAPVARTVLWERPMPRSTSVRRGRTTPSLVRPNSLTACSAGMAPIAEKEAAMASLYLPVILDRQGLQPHTSTPVRLDVTVASQDSTMLISVCYVSEVTFGAFPSVELLNCVALSLLVHF